jgi:exonuclease SbcC
VELNAASARLPEDESQFDRLGKQTERLRDELAELENRLVADQQAAQDLPAVEQQLRIAQEAADGLTRDRNNAAERRGFLAASAERRGRLGSEIARLTTVFQQDQNELAVYTELFAAFGRSGVPAMLIDAAVPRIETEANLLLGRMTDNRMAVRLQTQRTNQGGSLTETLDILVSDELGARSYEVFSGGEAFRINLALRIALSKVLAQRMGVPLPTLFIDEGFGTQDASGRERIVDTISSIQNEFEKIIVITHLDDIKDLFPVRIEVEKTDSGSNFWVSA